MATLTSVDSVEKTLTDASPTVKLDVTLQKGVIRRLYGSYLIDAADEFGTSGLISMFTIPAGARIIHGKTTMPVSASTGIYDVGWAASADAAEAADATGFFSQVDPGAAAVVGQLMLETVTGYNKRFASPVECQVDFTEATADSGGDTLELELWYVLD
jgi:hypothetical protein